MRKLLSLLVIALVLVALYPQLSRAYSRDPSLYLNKNSELTEEFVAYGSNALVAKHWSSFVLSGNPSFGRHPSEPGQQIASSDAAFTAGIYQVVDGVTPGATYYGFTGSASSWAVSGDRGISGKIGRTVGFDPYGGTNAASPNVIWGSELWDNAKWNFDNDPQANPPRVWAVAQGTKITFFVKVMYPNAGLSAQAWLWDAGVILDRSKPIQALQTPTPVPTAIPVVAKPIRPEADYDVAGGRFYTQATGESGTGRGFAITDDGGIPFYSEFKRLGGVNGVGYPTSRRFMWNGYVVQLMQKVAFQWRPEVGQVYFVNIFDEMNKAGKDEWLQVVRSVPKNFDTSPDAGLAWPQVVNRHLDILNSNQAIKAVYQADSDPINHFGLPMAYADYGNVEVVRAQRAVIQQWKVEVPWARAGQVTIANGGDVAKEAGMFGPEITTPEDPPA